MKKERQVRSYKRRTKSGKTVTVKAHTAKYEAADEKAKEVSKKLGAGKELEERKKKPVRLDLPFDKEEEKKVLDEVKDEEKKSTSKKSAEKKTTEKKSEKKATKTSDSKSTSEPAFTAAEFKEWYRGTGSAADKKVAKALRAQLGRAGYRKLEDEAIDNYSSRGHLSMFKRVSGGSEVSAKTSKSGAKEKAAEAKTSKVKDTKPSGGPFSKSPVDEGSTKGNLRRAVAEGKITQSKADAIMGKKPNADYSKRKSTWANLDALRRDPRLSQAVHFDRMIADLSKKSAVRKLPLNMAKYYQFLLGGKESMEITARKVLSAMPQKYYKKYLEDFNADGGSDTRLWKYGRRW